MKKLSSVEHLKLLGEQITSCPEQYNADLLEVFDNPHTNRDYWVNLNCPEFTSLCPKTGQPDFARIIIAYIPDLKIIESKSLKLYLFSFRNHGEFHENCVNIILNDLVAILQPKYIEVLGLFNVRGGISIRPYANYANHEERWKKMGQKRLARFDIFDDE